MAASDLSPNLVREELEKILASPGFARNERLGQFLRFVVENRLQGTHEALKEYTVGVEVFGRKPDYDPKLDSIVRTEASRLRKRLAEYYGANGATHRIVIEIPKGGYIPVFRSAIPGRQPANWKKIGLLAAAVAFVVVVIYLYLASTKPAYPVVAVLPLKNLSTEPDSELFVDGLTDELIRNLSIIQGLETRSQTSSFTFKNKPYSIPEVGRQLAADYIIEGSVLRSGSKLRINARLIRVSDDTPIESWRIDRDLEDIFIIQDEISRSVVNQLRLTLGRGKRRYNTNAETYDLYLKARSLLISRRQRAGAAFEEVIGKDPAFAPAYAGLARASILFGLGVDIRAEGRYSSIRSAAEKALQIDPLLAEAHAARGIIQRLERDWDAAEKSLRRAIELEPSMTEAYLDRATGVLFPAGRFAEALREVERAARVDPLSRAVLHDRALILMGAGRFEEAIQNCRPLLAMNPPFPLAEQIFARALVQQGKFAEAIPILEKQVQTNGDAFSHYLGFAYARAGRREEAEALAAQNKDYSFRLAIIYAGLRDKERTLEVLARMAEIKEPRAVSYTVFPELAFLREDGRFRAFRKKLGLPEELPSLTERK